MVSVLFHFTVFYLSLSVWFLPLVSLPKRRLTLQRKEMTLERSLEESKHIEKENVVKHLLLAMYFLLEKKVKDTFLASVSSELQ